MNKLSDIKTKDDAIRLIEYHLMRNGSHTPNLIGMVLTRTSKVLGVSVANELVRDFDLDELYGFQEEIIK